MTTPIPGHQRTGTSRAVAARSPLRGPGGWSLRVLVAALTLVPLLTSTTTLALGTERFDQEVAVNPLLDHGLRYLGGVYLGLGGALVYAVVRWHRAGTVLTVASVAIAVGGLGRLVSVLAVGSTAPLQWVLIVVELSVPLLVVWYRRLAST